MIVIPPQDPNETNAPDPAAEALGQLYEQFTNVQNLAEFHAALRKRDALYDLQHREMIDNPGDFENLHPKDFFDQFHRRADEDDKAVVAEAPYRVRGQLRDALAAERGTALDRAREAYKRQFINRQLAELAQDRLYYLGKMADAANDQDRERYLAALVGRLKLSGDVGLLYKEDAERLIENIPSDLDSFAFNREFASDPARAQRLLLYGAYPNIRPELREEMVKAASLNSNDSASNTELSEASNEQTQSPANDQLAALATKATPKPVQSAPASPAKEAKIKVNELDAGAAAESSTQDRPRMRDTEGGETEHPVMNDEKAKAARREKQRAESEAEEEDNEDIKLLARLIFAESAGDYNKSGAMEGIGWTVRNRVQSGDFGGRTYQDVIFAPRQFNAVGGPLWRKAGDPSTLSPEDAKAYARALEAARAVYRGITPDPTDGSIGFHSLPRYDFPGNPAWQYSGQFGNFKFFKR